jgi:hypothetical protein
MLLILGRMEKSNAPTGYIIFDQLPKTGLKLPLWNASNARRDFRDEADSSLRLRHVALHNDPCLLPRLYSIKI